MLGRNFFRKRALKFEILICSNMMIKRKYSSRVKLSSLLVPVGNEILATVLGVFFELVIPLFCPLPQHMLQNEAYRNRNGE